MCQYREKEGEREEVNLLTENIKTEEAVTRKLIGSFDKIANISDEVCNISNFMLSEILVIKLRSKSRGKVESFE